MPEIVFDDVSQGMNNRVSARSLLKVGSDGKHHGPFPLLHNIDRSEGTFKTRATYYLMNMNTETNHILPGRVVGVYTTEPIKTFDWEANLVENLEQVWVGCRGSSVDYVGRLIVTSANTSSFQLITALTKGTDPISFIQTDEKHLLVYNGTAAKVINCFNSCEDNMNTAFCDSAVFSTTATLDITDTDGKGQWSAVSRDLINGYLSVRVNNVWYGPQAISSIKYYPALLGHHTYRITFSAAFPGIAKDDVVDKITGAGVYAYCFGAKLFGCPPPPVKPTAVIEGTAGTGNLIGTYQWAYTFEGIDGMESNFSPWSDPIVLNGQKAMVCNVNVGARSGETWEAYGTAIRAKVYRRGGMMGDSPRYVGSLSVPWMLDSSSASPTPLLKRKIIGHTVDTVGITGTDMKLDVSHGALENWPEPGTCRFVDLNTTGYSSTVGEVIRYETVDEAAGELENITRGYLSSASSTWDLGSCAVCTSIIDNTADDALSGVMGPYDYDHAVPPQDIKFALKTGNKLLIVSAAYPYQICASSVGGWQYFRGDFAQTIDPNNSWTGGLINIGIDTMPITGMAELEPGVVIVFKSDATYSMVGRSLPLTVVDLVRNVPGCDSPYSIQLNRYGLIWMNRMSVYWWDGQNPVVDLTLPLSTLKSTTARIDTSTLTWGRCVWAHSTDDIYRLHYSLEGDTVKCGRYIEWDWRYPITISDKQGAGNIMLPSPTTGDRVHGLHAHVSDRRESEPIIYAGAYTASAPYYLVTLFGSGYTFGTATAIDAGYLQVKTPSLVIGPGTQQVRMESYAVNVASPVGAPAVNVSIYPVNDEAEGTASTGALLAAPTVPLYQTLDDYFATDKAIFCRAPSLKLQAGVRDMQVGTGRHNIERFSVKITGGREIAKPRHT